MTQEQWWSRLTPGSRTWLIENNGDTVPESIAAEVAAAGGPPVGSPGTDGAGRLDDETDWIEARANLE
jgi:hypothetical protein